MAIEFHKYHALGNDYIILDPLTARLDLTPKRMRLLCHRHFGIGSDGILWGPLPEETDCSIGDVGVRRTSHCGPHNEPFRLRIYNPDGSEAEKSGNGLRMFARFLFDTGRVGADPVTVVTQGGNVSCQVLDGGGQITVEMGQVRFESNVIPVKGSPRNVLNEQITVGDRVLTVSAATIGNPHCVVFRDALSVDEVKATGTLLENHPQFPNRTNVQFVKVVDRSTIRIEIWERGAGYTLASGSSASAAAATAKRLGYCDGAVTVKMQGGELHVVIDEEYRVTMTGPATPVAHGKLAQGFFEQNLPDAVFAT